VNDLLPLPIKSKDQMAMNHTKRAKKYSYSSEKITIDEYVGQAIFWACKFNTKKLKNIWVDLQHTEAIQLLEKTLTE